MDVHACERIHGRAMAHDLPDDGPGYGRPALGGRHSSWRRQPCTASRARGQRSAYACERRFVRNGEHRLMLVATDCNDQLYQSA
jgi:hypothetical protein